MTRIEVVDIKTDEVVHMVEVQVSSQVEKVMNGMLRRVNLDRFFLREAEVKEKKR